MLKENIQTKLICLKDSGLSLDECQFTGRLEFHDTHSIASLVSSTTCAEIRATEIFLNFDKEIDEFFLFSLFNDSQRRFSALKKITVAQIQKTGKRLFTVQSVILAMKTEKCTYQTASNTYRQRHLLTIQV